MTDYEKLGVFYLGRPYDLSTRKSADPPLLYDSKDLVTHAVCVGMTGSGKTGLCIGLLEEAAIDGIPAIVIDPKGDLSNLLLTFPNLSPADFLPWINVEDAARKGMTPEQFAQAQADLWRNGLASWQQDASRIQRLRDSADFAIYTPGSSAGLSVSILKSFARPGPQVLEDSELRGEAIRTNVSGLLGLAGVDADPMQSREHILLSQIINHAWSAGKDLDLAQLIAAIQNPPVQRIGVMDLESFFPQKDRFGLAMRLNNLLAAPGFESWLNGEALDVGNFLYTPTGRPRICIFSIAHLSDAERMFFVSLLLNQILGWTRSQSGTTSLRAIVYMDEIFGYFPPVANPPSKQPLLTLLKQARAFGVGVVLATQNPVDLDYKGLANCGTWFIGRLQTDRDKQRVLDGLEGASANASSGFDRSQMDSILSGLGNRVFLMNNVHDDAPTVFETRWCLSYLRGPLTRQQIKQLVDQRRGVAQSDAQPASPSAGLGAAMHAVSRNPERDAPAAVSRGASGSREGSVSTLSGVASARPVLPPQVPQFFLPIRSLAHGEAKLVYKPMLLGTADVFFADAKQNISAQQQQALLAPVTDGPVPVDWQSAQRIEIEDSELQKEPETGATFGHVPGAISQARSFDNWKAGFADTLYRVSKLELLRSPTMKTASKPDESERDFRARLTHMFREERDQSMEKLRQKYAGKMQALQDRIRRAEAMKQKQAEQASGAKWSSALSFGSTILGALMGRKKVSATNVTRAAGSMRSASRAYQESKDVARADENVQALQEQYRQLEMQLQAEIDDATAKLDAQNEELESIALRPKKTDVKVRVVSLAWAPYWVSGGNEIAAWQ